MIDETTFQAVYTQVADAQNCTNVKELCRLVCEAYLAQLYPESELDSLGAEHWASELDQDPLTNETPSGDKKAARYRLARMQGKRVVNHLRRRRAGRQGPVKFAIEEKRE